MTRNLTINRKRLEAIAYGSVRQSQEEGIELARMALTTIDSEMAVPDYFHRWYLLQDSELIKQCAGFRSQTTY
jgi:hypothetical protein